MWKCPICLVFFLFFTLRVRVRNRKLPPLPALFWSCLPDKNGGFLSEIRPCQRIFSVKSVAQPHRAASKRRSELCYSQYVPFWKDFYIPNRNLSLSKPYFATQHPPDLAHVNFSQMVSYSSTTTSRATALSESDAMTQWDKIWVCLGKLNLKKSKILFFFKLYWVFCYFYTIV